MKKILSLCLAALMIFSVLPAAFAAEEVETIANIEETSEYAEAIKFLNTLDVYTGKENGDLAADEPVERWQMANFLYRVATGDVDHSDVKTTTNYTPFKGIDIGDFDGSCAENLGAISWAYQAKVVNGYSATEYGPTDVIIYQDAITMIVRLLGERYTAASYPYGFVTTARELGILDGITGIGLEDEISRGVVAQLLYNAMFADVDGVSLSEKVFGIEKDIVLLTATQNVAYSDSSKVIRDNMIRFAELDAQGEPYGAGYHADFSEFGLEDEPAADAAVGTSYVVYHKNNYEDIISAEALWTVYENRGYDNMEVTGSKLSMTFGGSSYYIVDKYSELNNKQGWNADAAGTDQVKLYTPYGKTATIWNTKYILADDGNVYTIDATTGLPKIYAYYSAIVDAYFAIQADGTWAQLDLSSILYTAGSTTTAGFSKITKSNDAYNVNFHSAYADYIVSDSSMDGYADRVTVKQYTFGNISFAKNSSDSNKIYFTIKGANEYDNDINDTVRSSAKAESYRWTGDIDTATAKSASMHGVSKYVMYYIDDVNKEVDIIDLFNAGEEDTYTVTGYVRNVNVVKNEIILNDGTSYTYGYDRLAGSPLKTKDYSTVANNYNKANQNLVKNVEIIQPLLNTYVTLYVVDDIVVYIAPATANKNFVVFDSFVSFDEDAIVAKGYTTVTNEYTEIKIKAFNGWTVGGFDYYLYFLSNLIGNKNYADVLPFGLYELYQVVSVDADGYYNLTMPTALATDAKLAVNEYGYITGTNGAGKFGPEYYVASNAADFWLILDNRVKGEEKVYAYTGKLNPLQLDDVDIYKATAKDDYVIIAGDKTDLSKIDGLFGGSVSFVVYNENVAQYDNNYWLNTTNPYEYQFLMTDVLTGGTVPVKMDPALVQQGWAGLNKAIDSLVESKVYKVIDGTLYADKNGSIAPSSWNTVMNYYKNAAGYLDGGMLTLAGGSRGTFLTEVGKEIIKEIYPNWDAAPDYGTQNSELVTAYSKKVTLYAINPDYANAVDIFYKGYLTSKDTVVTDYVKDSDYAYNVYYVIKEDGTAIAWTEKTDKELNFAAGTVTSTVASHAGRVAMSYNRDADSNIDSFTVTLTDDWINEAEGQTYNVVLNGGVVLANQAPIAKTVADGKITSLTFGINLNGSLPTSLAVQVVRSGSVALTITGSNFN